MAPGREQRPAVPLGRISGVFGVRGWVKVFSWTRPRENILAYPRWQLELPDGRRETLRLLDGRQQGRGLVARLEGCSDADEAMCLVGAGISVAREELPPAGPGQYYWSDLEGLAVETTTGTGLGQVDSLIETGANDVLVVIGDRRRLIPFVHGQVVREVDLAAGRLVVDWDPAD
ncbi:MAG: ribosome maturation factor RimM [Chromatiales bacterium]|nr:ribosome maturation factor RimM [Chromatiales bacterium]